MLCLILGENKDVVQVNHINNIYKALQGCINVVLERSRCISKHYRHYQVFVIPVFRLESGFPLISFLYANPVIGVLDVNLCKPLRP